MLWLIGLNVLMYVGAAALYFTGFGILALICVILAAVLSLVLSGGQFNPFELFD